MTSIDWYVEKTVMNSGWSPLVSIVCWYSSNLSVLVVAGKPISEVAISSISVPICSLVTFLSEQTAIESILKLISAFQLLKVCDNNWMLGTRYRTLKVLLDCFAILSAIAIEVKDFPVPGAII